MKANSKIIGGLVLAWLLATTGTSHAQTTANIQDSFSSINLTPVPAEPMVLSFSDVAAIRTLSDAQLTTLVEALDATPTVPCVALPRQGLLGNFFSLQHPEWPPLPFNSSQSAVWPMEDFYLMNDVGFDYDAPPVLQISRLTGSMLLDGIDPPGAGDDGTNTTSNGLTNSPGFIPDYGTNLWIAQTQVANGCLAAIGSNTLADVQYEIQSLTNLTQSDWLSEGFIFGSEMNNWTPFSLAQGSRTNLFIRLRSWASSAGSGLPDWWQWQYFGTTDVDPYGNPAGDGWSNLQKFQNGWNPNQFYTPAPPQVTISFNAITSVATISWLPSSGAVTNYLLEINDWLTGYTTNLSLSSDRLSFQINLADESALAIQHNGYPTFALASSVQAQYAGGGSDLGSAYLQYLPTADVNLVLGPQGRLHCVFKNLPADLSKVRIFRQEAAMPLQVDTVLGDYAIDWNFLQNVRSPLSDGYFEIPAASIVNGVCVLPDLEVPPFFAYTFWIQTVRSNGVASGWADPDPTSSAQLTSASAPFIDARSQLKDNLRFLLRAATDYSPFTFHALTGGFGDYGSYFTWPNDYVFADCYYSGLADYYDGTYYWGSDPNYNWQFNSLRPINDNCFYRNFLFDQNHLAANGFLDTGVYPATSYLIHSNGFNYYKHSISITNFPSYSFNLAAYFSATNPSVPASQLTAAQSQWILPSYSFVSTLGGTFAPDQHNGYGLPYVSEKLAYVTNGQSVLATCYPGNPLPAGVSGVGYLEMAQPIFQSAGYYFARPGLDLMPEQAGFTTNNTTPFMIQGVGSSQQIAGYARLGLQNGNAGVYGYLGQYFDQAYKANTNGTVTGNTTGILSPQGNFFATEPGPVALVTLPDIDTGARGTCTVYSVSLQLDANHDGNMDLSFTGTDATSPSAPFVFWANSNYDRGHTVDGSDFEQDDLGTVDISKLPAYQQVPDCNYVNASVQPAIPSTRDLQDYFRLWTPGLVAAMAAAPTNYTVKLTLTGDAQIRIFRACETSGGTNYLFDATTASNQVASSASLYVGLLTSSSPIVLTSRTNEHYIFCGVQTGWAQLDLQILAGNQNVVADAPAYFQISDIKQMYERWSVGEQPRVAPKSMADKVADGAAPGFQYPSPETTNTPYILFVHGWNMETWEKDHYAESAYKRLYWQGYQGRFGFFRWPTDNNFGGIGSGARNTPLNDPKNYDRSESNAWASATGLLNKLNDLNTQCPGNVYLMAHSMGNVVAGEALRLAGNSQVANTYIAMQGAVPAHCYDASTASRWSIGPPDRYAHYWTSNAPCYFNGIAGAGNFVNFFNTNDYALNLWITDQDFKPDFGYQYSPSLDQFLRDVGLGSVSLYFPTNTYEIFGYADPARSYALGAQVNMGGIFQKLGVSQQINLQSVWPSDAHPNHDYSEHVWHSAQFRSDNPSRANFWKTVLGVNGFNLK